MKILALDTTGLVASVALVDENKTIAEFTTNYKKTHSQTIMPMVENLKNMVDLDLSTIDYIACACGPGSFIPVPTLDALAYNMFGTNKLVVPIMDARRNQVYSALYYCGEKLERVSDYMAQDIDEVISQVLEIDENAVFLGDGVPVFMDKLKQYDTFTLAPVSANMQRSACVGAIALETTDKAVECNKFEIMYLRKSQAERELEEKNGASTIK